MYLSNKDLSRAIQNDLKAAGVPRSAYSIRVRDCGYSTSVDIKVKDLSISVDKVETIAKKYQFYEVDQANGEILQGGNTYVFVTYDWHTVKDAAEPYKDQATEIFGNGYREITTHGNGNRLVYLDTVPGEGFLSVKVPGQANIGIGKRFYCRSAQTLAEGIAIFTATGWLN